MAQQTAVIWLQQAMKSTLSHEQIMAVEGLYQQALAMEKELIAKAWDDGDYAYFYSKETGRCFDNGEQYYNETYGK